MGPGRESVTQWLRRTARDGVHGVWDALGQGAEFSPPFYHLMLQAILAAGFDDPVLLRLPSILAIYVVALAAFALVRRRFALPVACLALVFFLSGSCSNTLCKPDNTPTWPLVSPWPAAI